MKAVESVYCEGGEMLLHPVYVIAQVTFGAQMLYNVLLCAIPCNESDDMQCFP